MIKELTTLTAEQLFNLLKEDDAAAFEELYNRYWFQLFLTAQKRLACREDAEEAVQNLFESLWKNRHKIKIRTSLENYLFAAIRYIVLRLLYRKMTRTSFAAEKGGLWPGADYSTEQTIAVNDLSKQIEHIVKELPDKCRKVFELSRYEMKTHREIAMIMHISEKTVENHITKALRLIKMNLNHFFFL
jgi:RNA polymerase sigma-70 factor (ECF subfamily)